jgi:hypothetical protein
LLIPIDSHIPSVSKEPIPQDILDDWEHCPVLGANNAGSLKGGSNGEDLAAGGSDKRPAYTGSSGTQERAKKGLCDGMTRFNVH